MAPLPEQLGHAHVNDIEGLESPTIGMFPSWLWRKLDPVLPGLSEVEVQESATPPCAFWGEF
jgi:6-pyruvoyltetrahydropterin/6-carboxytetrahydropterin synthase